MKFRSSCYKKSRIHLRYYKYSHSLSVCQFHVDLLSLDLLYFVLFCLKRNKNLYHLMDKGASSQASQTMNFSWSRSNCFGTTIWNFKTFHEKEVQDSVQVWLVNFKNGNGNMIFIFHFIHFKCCDISNVSWSILFWNEIFSSICTRTTFHSSAIKCEKGGLLLTIVIYINQRDCLLSQMITDFFTYILLSHHCSKCVEYISWYKCYCNQIFLFRSFQAFNDGHISKHDLRKEALQLSKAVSPGCCISIHHFLWHHFLWINFNQLWNSI